MKRQEIKSPTTCFYLLQTKRQHNRILFRRHIIYAPVRRPLLLLLRLLLATVREFSLESFSFVLSTCPSTPSSSLR